MAARPFLAAMAAAAFAMNTAAGGAQLLDFSDPGEVALFRSIDDAVMGGVSGSRFDLVEPGIAAFRGEVSLAYGGGFASVRTPPRAWDTAGAGAFLLRVKGDGKQYKFTLRTDDAFDGVQYQARFQPPAGAWVELELAVGDFVASYRGRAVPDAPPLAPGQVRTLGFMISEKQAGPFELLIDRIAVVR